MSALHHTELEDAVYERVEQILDAYLPQALSRRLTSERPGDDERSEVAYVPASMLTHAELFTSDEALEYLRGSGKPGEVVVCVFPFGNLSRLSGHSGHDQAEEQVMAWTLRVQVAFVAPDSKGGYRQRRKSGRLETQREFSRRLSRIYRGAVIDVLLKYLQGGAGVQVVQVKTLAGAPTAFDSNQIVGRAHADLYLEQVIEIPKPTHTIG